MREGRLYLAACLPYKTKAQGVVKKAESYADGACFGLKNDRKEENLWII